MSIFEELSRREREVMEILYALGKATLGEVAGRMGSPPTRPALRSIVTILEEKGHVVRSGTRGREHVFRPRRQPQREGRAAWRKVLATFFGGSMEAGLAAYLNDPSVELSPAELETIEKLVRDARRRVSEQADGPRKRRGNRDGREPVE